MANKYIFLCVGPAVHMVLLSLCSLLPDNSDGTAHVYSRCLVGTPWVLGKGLGRTTQNKHATALWMTSWLGKG